LQVEEQRKHALYNANLSFKGINQYLNSMMENKLLLKTNEDYNPVYYASEKGLTFISSYTQLLQLLQSVMMKSS